MIEPNKIDELLRTSDPAVHRILGVEHCSDPDQATLRMVRAGQVPHMRIGRRIRFSLPALQRWAAEQIANSCAASAAQNTNAQIEGQSLTATA